MISHRSVPWKYHSDYNKYLIALVSKAKSIKEITALFNERFGLKVSEDAISCRIGVLRKEDPKILPARVTISWTEENNAQLIQLRSEGHTYQTIANYFNEKCGTRTKGVTIETHYSKLKKARHLY